MLEMTTSGLSLAVAEDGSSVRIGDRRRSCCWRVDLSRATSRLRGDEEVSQSLTRGQARRMGTGIEVSYPRAGDNLTYHYTLAEDHVEVRLRCEAQGVGAASLPGPLIPARGPWQVAVPLYQGLLLGGSGEEWELTVGHGGHTQFSMAMGAVLGENGGLLVCHESPSNWQARFGRTGQGPVFQFVHERCPIDGWSGAGVRLYPVDADVTSACKRYRARVKERGEFVCWEEKIARKPVVGDLFGALMAFVGYNACPDIDYAEGVRKLTEAGFGSVFCYPVRMCHYSLDFRMGGDEPIWLTDDEVRRIKSVKGAHVSPWVWVIEAIDDGSEAVRVTFRKGADGRAIPHWQIDRERWYLVCTPFQIQHLKRRLAGDMAAMDWLHFDVNAMWPGRRCFDAGHAAHGGQPMGRLEDVEWTRRLFSPRTVGNRVVSSEGFADHYAGHYDIGSTKMMPPRKWDPSCVPVPMTMLVFHDSCIHDWWEVHNYNAHPGFGLEDLPNGLGTTGSGRPRLKAAMDALYGCPPNLFPFGKQYGWADMESRETYSYVVRIEDEAVQQALHSALPVAELHRKAGMQDLVAFEFLSEGRAVQATTFSDGTRVVANLSEQQAEAPGVGTVPPRSWRVL